MKKLLIAATHSGVGKTTLTLGLMSALYQRGLRVQPYKVGPDYIDTGWHQQASTRTSRNLDAFMLPPETLVYLFNQAIQTADIGVIEGVMGLYDGFGMRPDYCSSAGIAKLLDCPTVLVVDGKAVSTSLAAAVRGFIDFDPTVNIVGVIINRVSSDSHYQLLKRAIEHYCNVKVFGYLPPLPELVLPSRHLGLIPSEEVADMATYWETLTNTVEQYIDIDALLVAAESRAITTDTVAVERLLAQYPDLTGINIAVAQDAAFHFYYQDNLELLERLGAKLIEFSPLADSALPECQAIYIGGGFPEVFAAQLESNHAMRQTLRQAHTAGIPIYAECGGLMYLAEMLITEQQHYQMVGILQGSSQMSKGLKRFGYAQGEALTDTLIARQGSCLKGHEFHHSQFFTDLPARFAIKKIRDGETVAQWSGGYQVGNTFASYLHLHFYQSPEIIRCWLGNIDRG